ncbi:HAMP domain-containing protein [Xylophilus sp. Kf1]|nr:HAMP domain-containing protein [Xylophilus sp. Kf1]
MTAWTTNLRFSQKFLLIGVLAFILFLVPTAFAVEVILGQISVAKGERTGLPPTRELLSLLRQSQQHRGLSAAFLSPSGSDGNALRARRSELDSAFARTRQAVDLVGDPKLAAQADTLVSEWQAVATSVSNKAIDGAQSNRQHRQLIAHELALIEDLANVSGLSLDPDAATYYLQRAVLDYLPRLTESMGQIRASGALVLGRGDATPEERARIETLADQARQHFESARKMLDLAAGNGELPAEVQAARNAALGAAQQGFALADSAVVKAEALTMPPAEWIARMTIAIDSQFALVDASFDMLGVSLDRQIASARRTLVWLCLLLATLAAAGAWVMVAITRNTTRALRSAVHVAEAVAAGDLTVQVRPVGRDEVARLLTAMQAMGAQLQAVVGSVRGNSESVASASAQIAQGNADLSHRTERQASALEETAASMEELSSTVQQNADSARQASQLAREASAVATQGGTVVQQVVQTMQGINSSSARIADIIGVIDSIAFQTNILALNAAVEAARAGEQGRGFAVVASEVRNLAQRSAGAAREIKTLISASVEQVGQGTQLVDQAGSTMREIVAAILKVSELVGTISAATAEQSAGVSQVGEAVAQLDTTTQQNAALVEESAAAASSLSAQARQLVQAVSVFRLA